MHNSLAIYKLKGIDRLAIQKLCGSATPLLRLTSIGLGMMSRVSLSGSEYDAGTVEFDLPQAPDRMAPSTPENGAQGGPPGNSDF